MKFIKNGLIYLLSLTFVAICFVMILVELAYKAIKFIIPKCYKLVPISIAGLLVYMEWQQSYNPASDTAHWAHVGGGLGTLLVCIYLKGRESLNRNK